MAKINQKIEKFEYTNNLFINPIKAKSYGQIGNIKIEFTKKFNYLQRLMWRMCFGLNITNYKD